MKKLLGIASIVSFVLAFVCGPPDLISQLCLGAMAAVVCLSYAGRIVLYSIGQTGFFGDTQDIDNPGDMPCRRGSKVGVSLDDDSTPSRHDRPLVQEHSGKGRFKRASLDRFVWTWYIFWG